MTEPAPRSDGAYALLWSAVLLVVSALGWGILYSLNRLATTDGIPFIPYVFWMGTGAALILLGLGAVFRTLPRLSWEHMRGYIALGTISFGMTYTVLAFVAPKVPAGVLGLGATLTPILTYPAAALFRMDRFRTQSARSGWFSASAVSRWWWSPKPACPPRTWRPGCC